jgi:hypothetical protein
MDPTANAGATTVTLDPRAEAGGAEAPAIARVDVITPSRSGSQPEAGFSRIQRLVILRATERWRQLT